MDKPLLILISGLPATGKSNLGKKIAQEFNFPLITKDEFKELFSDTLEIADEASSINFGRLARTLLPFLANKFLQTGQSIILEGNFKKEIDENRFKRLLKDNNVSVVQILCKCDGKILLERFKKRVNKGLRHKIHLEHYVGFEKFEKDITAGNISALDLPGEILELDTTQFEKIDYEKVFSLVRRKLEI